MKKEQESVDAIHSHLSQLLPEEAREPFDVLHAIMDAYSIKELQDGLWELLYCAMASSGMDGVKSHTRAKYLDLYRVLLRLTEIGALIHQYKLYKNCSDC